MSRGGTTTTDTSPAVWRRYASLILVTGLLVVGGLIWWLVATQGGRDYLANNESNSASCAQAVTRVAATRAASDLESVLGESIETHPVSRCQGWIVEIQYVSDSERTQVVEALTGAGAVKRPEGWFWGAVPLMLRNV